MTTKHTHFPRKLSVIGLILFSFTSPSLLAHDDNEDVTTAQFNQIDVNGNGYLSVDETKTKTEITRWMYISNYGGFELADVNVDGRLDKAEFAAFEEHFPVE